MRGWAEFQEFSLIMEYSNCEDPRELAERIGKSYISVKTAAVRLGLKRKLTANIGRTTSTPEIDQFLIENYLTMPQKAMGEKIGKSYTFVKCRLRQLGLEIPLEIRQRFAAQSRIQPGSEPVNKGKKWADFMTTEGQDRCRSTQFRKGNLPHNTKKDYAIGIRTDKTGIQYQYIRIRLGKWMPLHRFIWEQNFGPIPPKMNLVFKNKNTFDCRIENLELLTNSELMKRNSYHNYPKPIALTIQLRGALNRQINKHLKKLKR